jgi:hypothetical protein
VDSDLTRDEIDRTQVVLRGCYGLARAARIVRITEALGVDFGHASRLHDAATHPCSA